MDRCGELIKKHHEEVDVCIRSACEKIVAESDERMKSQLLFELSDESSGKLLLSNSTEVKWQKERWAEALSGSNLAKAMVELGLPSSEFPVPSECGYWHAPESDCRDNLVFRFFKKEAFLTYEVPKVRSKISFLAFHPVVMEALETLHVSVNGASRVISRDGLDVFGRERVSVMVDDDLLQMLSSELFMEVRFSSRAHGIPSLMYANSNDSRNLSLAISLPKIDPI